MYLIDILRLLIDYFQKKKYFYFAKDPKIYESVIVSRLSLKYYKRDSYTIKFKLWKNFTQAKQISITYT